MQAEAGLIYFDATRMAWQIRGCSPTKYQEWIPGRSKLLRYTWQNYKARCRHKTIVNYYPANLESLRKIMKVCVMLVAKLVVTPALSSNNVFLSNAIFSDFNLHNLLCLFLLI